MLGEALSLTPFFMVDIGKPFGMGSLTISSWSVESQHFRYENSSEFLEPGAELPMNLQSELPRFCRRRMVFPSDGMLKLELRLGPVELQSLDQRVNAVWEGHSANVKP